MPSTDTKRKGRIARADMLHVAELPAVRELTEFRPVPIHSREHHTQLSWSRRLTCSLVRTLTLEAWRDVGVQVQRRARLAGQSTGLSFEVELNRNRPQLRTKLRVTSFLPKQHSFFRNNGSGGSKQPSTIMILLRRNKASIV